MRELATQQEASRNIRQTVEQISDKLMPERNSPPMYHTLTATGDFGPWDEWNPQSVIDSANAWPLLDLISRGGVKPADLAGLQPAVERLRALNLIDDRSGEYVLGFPWFSAADQARIQAQVEPFARTLAEEILTKRTEIEAELDRLTCAGWADRRDLRFALVGCFGLDWGGLDCLSASGRLVWQKLQPGDRHYLAFYEEPYPLQPGKLYCGSHSATVGDYTWTSFGDTSGRRFGLPDLLWQTAGAGVRDALDMPLLEAGHALAQAARGTAPDGPGRTLLEAAGALRDGRPAIPVFFAAEDGAALDRVVQIVQERLDGFLHGRYAAMQKALCDLTPVQHGIPFPECFNPIYHVLFGQVNRLMAEDGYMTDPAPSEPGEGRYRCWLTVAK
jgi:hypothetical protein